MIPDEGPLFDTSKKTANKKQNTNLQKPDRSVAAQWGNRPELFETGFLVVPHKFLRRYCHLTPTLTAGEALFVLHLMSFKWEEAAPFPSYKTLAENMGVSDKMVRRYAQSLQRKGYLRRRFRTRAPNAFDLTELFKALGR